ncbi:unnamed protein product, partial [Ectocarpus sp. 12 AP-2014]
GPYSAAAAGGGQWRRSCHRGVLSSEGGYLRPRRGRGRWQRRLSEKGWKKQKRRRTRRVPPAAWRGPERTSQGVSSSARRRRRRRPRLRTRRRRSSCRQQRRRWSRRRCLPPHRGRFHRLYGVTPSPSRAA